jgi:hypothetical protein
MIKSKSSREKLALHTLLVTALANFLRGAGSCGLHKTEQYSRSISIPRVTLGTCLPSDFADAGRDDGAKYLRLFFFCKPVGDFGLWRAYVIDRAKERSRSGDGLLSINDLNADRQGWRDSLVSSPLFRVSNNFLLTPSAISFSKAKNATRL